MFAPGLPSHHHRAARPRLHGGPRAGLPQSTCTPASTAARCATRERARPNHRVAPRRQGRITIPGFYDGVQELTGARARIRSGSCPTTTKCCGAEVGAPRWPVASAGSVPSSGSGRAHAATSTACCPATPGEGAKTVLPGRAMAKVSMRLVPGQDYRTIERKFAGARPVAGAGGRRRPRWRRSTAGAPWYAAAEGRDLRGGQRSAGRSVRARSRSSWAAAARSPSWSALRADLRCAGGADRLRPPR
jgi:acetylornithine deacetylase/succinyl-diaminopimelate desuccinylase-like protein